MCHNAPMAQQDARVSNWKVIRWSVVAFLVLVVLLLMKNPAPITQPMAPDQVRQYSESFETKLQNLADSHARGETDLAHFSEDEINAEFQKTAQEQALKSGQSPSDVQAWRFSLANDTAVAQTGYSVAGKEVELTIAGKIGISDGYFTFTPTEGRIGSMPMPLSVLKSQLKSKLLTPENRDKLKLPDYISDLRIEDGQLIIAVK